jgi:hypothetical protein
MSTDDDRGFHADDRTTGMAAGGVRPGLALALPIQ